MQTSCHSAHIENGEVLPCGRCFKCVGVLIFLLANNIDPRLIRYREDSIISLPERISKNMYRLDRSELEHSLYLINKLMNYSLSPAKPHWYVETIRFDPYNSHFDNIPFSPIREKIYRVLEMYTQGYSLLKNGEWVQISRKEALRG